MSKKIKIPSLAQPFPTKKAALDFFEQIKNSYDLDETISEVDFGHVNGVFEEYCRLTKHPVPSGIIAYMIKNKVQDVGGGRFSTWPCYWHRTSDGSEEDFSIKKAIDALSADQNA